MALYVVVIFYLAFKWENKFTYMAQPGSSIWSEITASIPSHKKIDIESKKWFSIGVWFD